MIEPAEGLRTLIEHPTAPPEPVEELYKRVHARRRRRARRRVAMAGLAGIALSVAIAPLVGRPDDRPTRIATGPGPSAGVTITALAQDNVSAGATGVRFEYSLPDGWETLSSEGRGFVVATRQLSDRDRELALLTRADAVFTALPPDVVVVAVGFDALEVKYGTTWDGTTIERGPAYALGPEAILPSGVRFRRGDVPQSALRIASYAGPDAPASRLREADTVAASIRQVQSGGGSVVTPPPASGSIPSGLRDVARAHAGASSLVLKAGEDCAYLRPADSKPQVPGHDHLGGGCRVRPAGVEIAAVGSTVLLWGDPGTAPSSAAIMRVGPGVRAVSARTADGRTFSAVLGADGWGIAAGTGRIVTITALDAAGRPLNEAFLR